MDWWWAAVGAAVAWTVLVALWGILTRSVANILVGVGLVMGALLSLGDERPGWHALGLAVTLLPAVGLYAAKAVTAGTAKGFGALGAILGLGAAPALWAVLVLAIVYEKVRGVKRAPSSHGIYFAGIAAASAVHAAHLLPPSML